MKELRIVAAVCIMVIVAFLYVGRVFIAKGLSKTPASEEIGLVVDGIDVTKDVLDAAKTLVGQLFEMNKADYPDYGYINWRIESLSHARTYRDLGGMRVVVYQMNYEFLTASPEKVVLVGGMYITDDNWVMPGCPNSTYLAFQQDAQGLKFLCSIVENDCTPGTDCFDEDLLRLLT